MFVERVKRHFSYDWNEVIQMCVTALAFGFIMALRPLESGPINYIPFLKSLGIMFIISLMVLFIHFSIQKLYAIKHGIDAKYVFNPIALGIGLYIGALFYNLVYFLSPGYLKVHAIKKQRIGKFRYRMWFQEFSSMAVTGIIGTLIVAGIASYFMESFYYMNAFVEVSLFVAALSLLPIPRNDGFHIFFGNWFHHLFIVGFTLSFIVLLYFVGFIYTLLFSLVVGFAAFLYLFNKIV